MDKHETYSDSGTHGGIVIIDFGSQYTQLIARRVREFEVFSEILPGTAGADRALANKPRGIILSGGPRSAVDGGPDFDRALLSAGVPVLGICYGMQLLARALGGKVKKGSLAEYGRTRVRFADDRSLSPVIAALPGELDVWMSHWDEVAELPPGARPLASSDDGVTAGFVADGGRVLGLQFHPEVQTTERGTEMLRAFVFDVCGAEPKWKLDDWIKRTSAQIEEATSPDARVVCALSGGVDSTVSATLVSRVIGPRLQCVFVDHGFMRKDEPKQVAEMYRRLDLNVTALDASDRFLAATRGVTDPERKRKIIGETFIEVFDEEAKKIGADILLQGTIYPDVIESGLVGGDVIKSHHNVGGLPERMRMSLLEPLRELFKDEVRKIGAKLGIPGDFLGRHPFPGPGLAIRCLGELTRERLDALRDADAIFVEEIRAAGLYDEIWQAFAALLPVRSVGVAGDARTYGETAVLRAVRSTDAMTAESVRLPWDVIDRSAKRICASVPAIGRVVMDVTGKPPATIEWE